MQAPVKRTGNIRGLYVCLFLVLSACLNPAHASESPIPHWQSLATEHTTIQYQTTGDLAAFGSRLGCAPVSSTGQIPADSTTPLMACHEEIAGKVDDLFRKSCDILGMHGFMNKISIRVFGDKQQQDAAFYELYKKGSTVRAWYTHSQLAIYVQINDLSPGMLAHELAHAIIDHYMIVPPPGESAEILARYVDDIVSNTGGVPSTSDRVSLDRRGYSVK